ncbi:uncharacterized protein LOC136088247 [Hydra vulgaris]|uniref:Uncharacterized protein LOC136088247 n=1 Tax=Hydra vulgaris TaxID=6087 RepID=A0ABM4D183_HYDVU
MSQKTGRKCDMIWLKYTRVTVPDRKGCRAVCNACRKEMEGQIQRMHEHIKKCKQSQPHEIMDSFEDQQLLEGNSPSTSQQQMKSFQPNSTSADKYLKIDKFFTRTSLKEKDLFDLQLGRFIYSTNSSFRTVEHKEFKKFINVLHPGYTLPNRTQIGGEILDRVYTEEIEKCNALNGKIVAMSLDGWSNVHNEPIVCISVITDKINILVETINTSGHSHTGGYLTQLAKEAIDSVRRKFGCTVKSFVTDNAANMKSMRQELSSEKDIITYGCAAHMLNLLANDLNIENVSKHVTQIIKYIRNNHQAGAIYKLSGGTKLPLPTETRWNSVCDSLEKYVNNWSIIFTMFEKNKELDPMIGKKVSDIQI